MERKQHTGRKLKRNHSNALPRYLIAFDAETLPHPAGQSRTRFSHRFRLGVAIVGRMVKSEVEQVETHRIYSPDHFWQLVESVSSMRHTVWIVCHNALFDMIVAEMPGRFERGEMSIDWPRSKRQVNDNDVDNAITPNLCVIESPPTIIAAKCGSTQGRVVIVDTLNWFPVPLTELGDACGLPKFRMPHFSTIDDEWFKYCERDTRIVFNTFVELIKWVGSNDMGMFRYTGPSQAWSAYRHRFQKHDIYAHDNEQVRSIERLAYFGGRSEVFKLGDITETVHQLDINSLFPAVMAAGEFPYLLDRYDIRDDYLQLHPNIDWKASVAEVELKTWEPTFPIRTDKGVVFPVGEFRTALCGKELEYAAKNGYIRAVRSWSEYKLAPLFTDWVTELWRMRQEYKQAGNKLYERFVKTLLNSLYGKFAQMTPAWQNVNGTLANLPWTSWTEVEMPVGTRHKFRSFGWQVQKMGAREEKAGTFVAVSAFVTSAARVYMNRIRDVIGKRDCYYQGVDGLVVTNTGRQRLDDAGLIDQTRLGYLRHELTANHGTISGVSDYRLGEKVAIAGKPRLQAIDEMRHNMQRRFHTVTHLFEGKSLDHVTEERFTWHKQTDYWKGTVSDGGWVEPHAIALEK